MHAFLGLYVIKRHTHILAKSLHWFHTELVYIVSRGQQTVMFVNTLRAYKRPNFSLRLKKNYDARQVGRVSIWFI